ncbi:cyclin-dependent kinase 12 [Tachysurus ichikawai]
MNLSQRYTTFTLAADESPATPVCHLWAWPLKYPSSSELRDHLSEQSLVKAVVLDAGKMDSTLCSEKPLSQTPVLTRDPAPPAAAPPSPTDDLHGDVASALLQLISQNASESKPTSSDSQCLKETPSSSLYSSPGALVFSQPEHDANTADANAGVQYPRDQDLRFTLGSCGEDKS